MQRKGLGISYKEPLYVTEIDGDKNEILASPVGTLTEKNEDILINKIIEKIHELKAETVVIGLPKNMNGTMGESALRAQKLAEMLRKRINIPVDLLNPIF